MFVISSNMIQDCAVSVPGSKSYTHRVFIAAALADGTSQIVNALRSEDTELTMGALRQMGVPIQCEAEEIEIGGLGGRFSATTDPIYLGNSGTSMRLLISMAALGKGEYILTGTQRMQERPVEALIDSLMQIGVPVRSIHQNGCPPLVVTGGSVKGGQVAIDCSVSSQFLSSLLLLAPLTQSGLDIRVSKGPVSKPYIDLTIDIMLQFGLQVERDGYDRFRLRTWHKVHVGEPV